MNSVFLIDTLLYGCGVGSDDEIPIDKLEESDFGPIISKFYKIYQYFSKQNKFMEYSHQILDDYLLSVFCFVLRYKSRESNEKKMSDDDENWNKRETFAWLFERIVKDFVSKSSSQGSIHKKINRLSNTQSTFLVNILIPELLKCMQAYQKETLEISDEMKEQRENLKKEMRKKEEEMTNQSSLINSGQKEEEEEKINNFKSDLPQQSSISRGGISYYINKSFFHLHLCVLIFMKISLLLPFF